VQELDRVAPDANVIIVSNPVDVLTRIALETSTRSEHLIFGSGTVLDTARLSISLARLSTSISTMCMCKVIEHGDSQFPFGQMLPLA